MSAATNRDWSRLHISMDARLWMVGKSNAGTRDLVNRLTPICHPGVIYDDFRRYADRLGIVGPHTINGMSADWPTAWPTPPTSSMQFRFALTEDAACSMSVNHRFMRRPAK